MEVKLKTWEEFEKEFKPFSKFWKILISGDVEIRYNKKLWYITSEMKKKFGKTMKFKESGNDSLSYTHSGRIGSSLYYWHELWFDDGFFKQEDFEL